MLPDTVLPGTLLVRDGRIAEIQPGRSHAAGAIDCAGDFLLPGAVDLHTDNLERQVQPRSGVRWPSRSALLAHDAQCAAAGVTTVLDALCVGDLGFDEDRPRTCREGAADLAVLGGAGVLKVEHYLHLRCELPAIGMIEMLREVLDHRLLRLISLMDHTPGQGQYADLAQYRAMRARDGEDAGRTEMRIAALQEQRARLFGANRAALLRLVDAAMLASHDDRTTSDIAANAADGIRISEFPVTIEAARAARQHGQQIIAGAPNVVRGGSHTGNVAVHRLVGEDLVDALASDYVPASLVEAAFLLAEHTPAALAHAVAMIGSAPAAIVGFTDRGALAPGLRADLVRVARHEAQPLVREVWCAGSRVA